MWQDIVSFRFDFGDVYPLYSTWLFAHLGYVTTVLEKSPEQQPKRAALIEREALCRFTRLQYLHVHDVDIKGTDDNFPTSLVYLAIWDTGISQFPFNPSRLKLLTVLFLDCDNLKCLPDSFGQMSALKSLCLMGNKLENLSRTAWQFPALETLKVVFCSALLELPDSFGMPPKLATLHLGFCPKLQNLPRSSCNLSRLTHLTINNVGLGNLPESFDQLSSLISLNLVNLPRLQKLPESLGQLVALRHLSIGWCIRLKLVPDCIHALRSLQKLELGPMLWQNLPEYLETKSTPQLSQLSFNVHGGQFVLIAEAKLPKSYHTYVQIHLHDEAMREVRSMNYREALKILEPHIESLMGSNDHDRNSFRLQESGIIRRLMGDLVGALENLSAALEPYFVDGNDDYECRKHRGFIKFLMGDLEGARVDGERALAIMPESVNHPDYGYRRLNGGDVQLEFLGGESLEYLGLKLR